MPKRLEAGDTFPDFVVKTVDGGTLKVPQELPGEYSALLFYRGGW